MGGKHTGVEGADDGTPQAGGAAVQRAPGKSTLIEGAYPATPIHETAMAGVASGGAPLPYLDELKTSFGDHGDVLDRATAHVGGAAADAAGAIGAEAYTAGDRIAFRDEPSRALVGHEAAHVVQQRAGVHLKGGVGAEGDVYEQNADAVGEAFASGRSAEPLLDGIVGGAAGATAAVQRKPAQPPGGKGGTNAAAGGAAAPAPQIDFDEARNAMLAIGETLEAADGIPVVWDDGKGGVTSTSPHAKSVAARWQPLLDEWWRICAGRWKGPGDTVVSYEGDILTTHIDAATAQTAPLVAELKAESADAAGVATWLAGNFDAPLQKLRQRAASQSVTAQIDANAKNGQGGGLDFDAMGEIDQLQAASVEAIKVLRAVMTVSTRMASANAQQAKAVDDAYAKAVGDESLPPSVEAARAKSINSGLGVAQGLVYAIQTIISFKDPKARYEHYKEQWSKFGKVAGATEFLKDLGTAVGGVTAVASAGAYAVATVAGKADLAARALSFGGQMTSGLGKINVALNALGVIHGITVLCDDHATPMEKTEAGVETASGALGLAGRFLPAISPYTAALSASLLINFYTMRGILQEGLDAYASLIALGFNICYESMKKDGGFISAQALKYASALDLSGAMTDPVKAAELVKQTEGLRFNLVEMEVKPFIKRATTQAGSGNADPGAYSTLRARFQALGTPVLDTPEHAIGFTTRLLQTMVGCFTDAQKLYQQQVYDSWKDGA